MTTETCDCDLVENLGDKIKIRVSSVLNKDVKQYGKKFMFDGKEDTCWNSDQGKAQAITFQCECPVVIKQLHVQFQGGFAGKDCKLEIQPVDGDEVINVDFYPEDVNQMQIFDVKAKSSTKLFKVNFVGSTDFFGRIIIYQLKIFGDIISS